MHVKKYYKKYYVTKLLHNLLRNDFINDITFYLLAGNVTRLLEHSNRR